MSFWPIFYFKGTGSKTVSFWSQKIKKEIRAFLYPLQPDVGEEKEKEKEKKKEKEVGD